MPILTRGGSPLLLSRERRRLLARYKRLRTASRRLNDLLIERLPGKALAQCAKELGLIRNGTITSVDLQSEGAIVMDYAIHDYRPTADRLSTAERFCSTAFDREAARLDADVAESRRLRPTARFALLEIVGVIDGLGVHVFDMLRGGESFLIADLSLSRTGGPGIGFVSRLVDAGDFRMSTGASLPVDAIGVDSIVQDVARRCGPALDGVRRLSALQQSQLARRVLHICLERYAVMCGGPAE